MNIRYIKNITKQIAIIAITAVLLLGYSGLKAQNGHKVTGTVVSSGDGAGLPGLSISIKGTSQGTVTDIDGNYTLENVSDDAVLVFSFVGFTRKEVPVNGQSLINVTMEENVETLDEVVVTSLGISREKKSLGYSVGEVKGEDLHSVPQENVLNSLSGRVSGVTINSTGTNPGSSVSVIIRGATSLAGDNQPLFVVDGVPVDNSLNGNTSEIGSRNVVDYGNAISDLNANDIESVSVLKGPSAAALYGSRAGNGVILITTKKGKRGDKDVKVNVSTSVLFDTPYKYYELHNLFATGVRPAPFPGEGFPEIDEGASAALGLPLDKGIFAITYDSPLDANGARVPVELVSHPDNFKDFAQTGITNENNIAVSGGSEIGSYRISLNNLQSRGVIPNSDFHKNSVNITGDYDLAKNLTLYTNVNIGKTYSDNRPAGNRGTNPLKAVLYTPSHIDINQFKDYWEPGQEGIQQKALPDHNNPYFLAYGVNNNFYRNRVYGNMKLSWKISSELTLMGRYSLDYYDEQRETKIPQSYSREPNGAYGLQKLYNNERNIDFLLTYIKNINDLSINASVGGNSMYRNHSSLVNSTKNRGSGLVVPNLYTVSNIDPLSLNYTSYMSEKAIYSIYGTASFGYKSMLYLDVTARNDWSSTLPEDNRSYFYPSASFSMLLNNMFEMPSSINLLKLRAGWAQVGNDTAPYRLQPTLTNPGTWGGAARMDTPNYLLSPNLKPEIATSFEYGVDLAFFNNRLRASITHYKTDNENQILNVNLPMSSGYNSKLINAGLVESYGWEATVGVTPVKTGDLTWDMDFMFSRNRTKIVELTEGVDYIKFWSEAKGGAYTFVGEEIGVLRDRSLKVVKDENSPYYGWPILDDEGYHDYESKDPKHMDIIGNFNPDFTLGLQASVKYKRFRLSMNLDWRKGGEFISQTYRYTESDMISQRYLNSLINPLEVGGDITAFLKANPDKYIKGIHTVGGPTKEMGGYYFNYNGWEGYDGIFNPGVYGEYDDDGNLTGYVENLGGENTLYLPMIESYPWSFARASTFAADFIKLREISFSYSIPMKKTIDNLTLSVYSRNIVLWTKAKVNIDPETAYQPENGMFKQGVERFNVNPWTFPIGFKVNVNF